MAFPEGSTALTRRLGHIGGYAGTEVASNPARAVTTRPCSAWLAGVVSLGGRPVFPFCPCGGHHLDSPLRSLALRDPALADLIGNATRQAFVGGRSLLDEQVDALLLAGDLYDGEQTSMKTARFLADQIRRLHEAEIKVFVIRGNHDAMSRITRELTFPDSVTIFGGRAAAVAVERERGAVAIVIHGISLDQAHAPESLL